MFYRWVFPNAQEQGQWRLDRSSLQDWTVSAERFQGNSVRSTYTDKHKYSIKHTYIYTYSTSLHVFANHRYSLSIHTTRFPHIILITMDHYTGFEAPIRHFNCIPDLWHFVYGKLRDAEYLGSSHQVTHDVVLATVVQRQNSDDETWRVISHHLTFLKVTYRSVCKKF